MAISQAWDALRVFAERLQMPVATTISGKGVFPDDHPLAIGVMGGQYGSEAANQAVAAADVVFLVGMKSSQQVTSAWTQPSRSQRVVHLDVDPAEISKIFPVEAGMVADAQAGLEALVAACVDVRPERSDWLSQVSAYKKQWHDVIHAEMEDSATPIRPQHLMAQIQARLNPEDIVVSDASFSVGWVGSVSARPARRPALPVSARSGDHGIWRTGGDWRTFRPAGRQGGGRGRRRQRHVRYRRVGRAR